MRVNIRWRLVYKMATDSRRQHSKAAAFVSAYFSTNYKCKYFLSESASSGGPSAAMTIKSSRCSDVNRCLSFVHRRFIFRFWETSLNGSRAIGHANMLDASLIGQRRKAKVSSNQFLQNCCRSYGRFTVCCLVSSQFSEKLLEAYHSTGTWSILPNQHANVNQYVASSALTAIMGHFRILSATVSRTH
jgi:hypothetical protein